MSLSLPELRGGKREDLNDANTYSFAMVMLGALASAHIDAQRPASVPPLL